MDLKEAILSRYATKSFDGRTVPDETVDELIELIRQASCTATMDEVPVGCLNIEFSRVSTDNSGTS